MADLNRCCRCFKYATRWYVNELDGSAYGACDRCAGLWLVDRPKRVSRRRAFALQALAAVHES